jgi:alanyl-tRNA synthetase
MGMVMDTAEIRRRFLAHFEQRDHTVVPSASLLLDDPNLLFVNAGMVPFVPYFLGQEAPPFKRAVTVQKCIRTIDIEQVGQTDRHGTFFQMNGNFSFGDYFKEGAISYAWDLVTKPKADGGYGLPESTLHVSVYLDDDESVALWKKIAGLPDEKIHRLGKADNYWSTPSSSSTVVTPMVPRATSKRPATGISSSGTSCSCRTCAARASARMTSRSSASCRPRTSTPAWASSG